MEEGFLERRYGLGNHVALVTGAGQGIGRGVALRLAAEDVTVVVNGRTQEKLDAVVDEIAQMGKKAMGIVAQVERKDEVLAMMEQIIATFGRIDFLVNNAGVTRPALVKDMTEEQWDTVLGINLKGTFLCSQAAVQHMIENRFGRIVNILSVVSFGSQGHVGRANYTASKAGLMALTRTMAQELAVYNIRVNGVGPGYIETELLRKVIAKDFLEEVLLDRTPLGRLGQPEEVAEAILFLLSEGASYITGETICIDGGIICGSYFSNKKVRASFLK